MSGAKGTVDILHAAQPLCVALSALRVRRLADGVGGLPRRQVVRHGAPLVAAVDDVQDGVDDLSPTVARGTSTGIDGGHQRLQNGPLPLAQSARIGLRAGVVCAVGSMPPV